MSKGRNASPVPATFCADLIMSPTPTPTQARAAVSAEENSNSSNGSEEEETIQPTQQPAPEVAQPAPPNNQEYGLETFRRAEPFLIMKVEEHWHGQPCVHTLQVRSRRSRSREGWIDIGICRVHPCWCWVLVGVVLVVIGGVIGAAVGVSLSGRQSESR